jgi:phospholipid transport system substrate-binding protein
VNGQASAVKKAGPSASLADPAGELPRRNRSWKIYQIELDGKRLVAMGNSGSRAAGGGRILVASLMIVLALPTLGSRAAAGAQPQDPTAMIKSVIDQTIAVFKDRSVTSAARQAKLRAIAEQHFDFAEMARSTVGYHWREFTPEQQQEFVPLFTSFIEDVYLDQIQRYSVQRIQKDIQSTNIEFTKQQIDGAGDAEVFSTVMTNERATPIPVNYRMTLINGEWKVYDLTVDSISVMANYRNQFNRVLNQGGYDKLVSIMREKQKALAATLAQ